MANNINVEETVRLLKDIEEIKNLKARYCFTVDGIPSLDVNKPRQIDVEKLADLFAQDATMDAADGKVVRGRAQLIELFKSFQALPLASHCIATPLVEVNGDTAIGNWHGIIPLITAKEKAAVLMVVMYEDTFTRTTAGWRISSIKATSHFASPIDQGWAKVRFMNTR